MKNLLIILLTSLLLLGTAQAADTGVWFNPERSGDGINLITRDETLVVYFYTYRDNVTILPPSVSPEPPTVDPIAPNSAAWYLGLANDYDGESATGILYVGQAINYPFVTGTVVANAYEVGTFEIVRNGEGWTLDISYSWNYLIPWYVSFYGVHDFPVPLITK